MNEMTIEEKYDKLYDQLILLDVTTMAYLKEMGLSEKYMEYSMKVMKKVMPSLMGSAFKLIKTLAPGRAFKMFIDGFVRDSLVSEPLSNIDIVSLSDREAVITTMNSVQLKKYKAVLKQTGLNLDLKEYWELMNESTKGMAKDFGFEMTIDTTQLEEDSFTFIIKLAS